MPSDTASTSSRFTIPISPTFSTDTASSAPRSEATSDEQPDLGAFTTILWAWNNLQPTPRMPIPQFHSSPSSSRTPRNVNDQSSISSFTHPGLSEVSGTESLGPEAAETVWAQHQLQSYFNLNSVTPSTDRTYELDEDESGISIVNSAYPDAGYEEPPPPSPLSDGSQTVEIYEATSDAEIPDTMSTQESQSPAGGPRAVPVMGLSPSQDGKGKLLPTSGAGGSSQTSRNELPLRGSGSTRMVYPSHSLRHTALSHQSTPLRNDSSLEAVQLRITPRQSDFPIYDQSSVYSQSTARTSGTRTQLPSWLQAQYNQPPDTVQEVLIDDTSSLYSYPTQDDSESAVQSLLNNARVARSIINDNSSVAHSVDHSEGLSIVASDCSPVISTSSPYCRREPETAPRSTPPQPIHAQAFSPQVEHPSPLPTPEESEVFVYSSQQQHSAVDGVDEDPSPTPTRALVQNNSHSLPKHIQEADHHYVVHGIVHPYPYPLHGHRVLPLTIDPSRPSHSLPNFHLASSNHAEDDMSGHSETELDKDQPSLGLLDEALSFIAAERAKYEALRAAGAHHVNGGLTPPEWQHVIESSLMKRKRRKKVSGQDSAAKPEGSEPALQLSRASSTKSATRPLLLAADPDCNLHESDYDATQAMAIKLLHATNDKRITLLTRQKLAVSATSTPNDIEDEPISLTGKKGKRVGRKEREREKAKRDRERAALQVTQPKRSAEGDRTDESEMGAGREEVEDEVEDEDDEGDVAFSSSGGSMSNLKATHLSAGSRTYIHQAGLGKGTYKSTPVTPRAVTPTRTILDGQDEDNAAAKGSEQDVEGPLVVIPPVKVGRSRKKSRKRPTTLEHAKSYPNLRQKAPLYLGDEDGAPAAPALPLLDQSKRSRLADLAHRLQGIFPEQHKDLKRVIQQLENGTKRNATLGRKGSTGKGKGRPKHYRNGSEGAVSGQDSTTDAPEQDPVELDIVNRTPNPGDAAPLIHVFIDHSNILIGLLNFLKRSPPPRSVVSDYQASHHVRPPVSSEHPTSDITPIPKLKKRLTSPLIESPAEANFDYPIPLPSFATAKTKGSSPLSKSLPTESVLDVHMAKRTPKGTFVHGAVSDGSEQPDRDEVDDGSSSNAEKKTIRFPRHLWHAALVLILERARVISRRVVVTSSPLYQPMENIQNLGYEVRVYMRVPNLGGGMDQERKNARYTASRSIYGTKGFPSKKTHMRHLSGSTSAESGSGGLNSQTQLVGAVGQTATTNAAVINKIKYREQGVDELLQLKLHQAIADVDVAPSGSTIVLATGDGNVGQFNEDGFLGPVRTALKRGWKVELYAWEDGLSRSWRREFGENSEWGKKGLFRIIPLEQFATSLVEAAGW